MMMKQLWRGRARPWKWRQLFSSSAGAGADGGSGQDTGAMLKEVKELLKEVNHTVRVPFPRALFVAKQRRAFELATKLVAMGSPEGRVRLAECVLWGFGRRSNPREAFQMATEMVREGNPMAMVLQANILRYKLEEEIIIPEHGTAAWGQNDEGKIAYCLMDNYGNPVVSPEEAQTPKELVKQNLKKLRDNPGLDLVEEAWRRHRFKTETRDATIEALYRGAAAKGSIDGAVLLGNHLRELNRYGEALELLEKAAESGDTRAYFALGEMYHYGFGNEPPDMAKALKNFGMAASLGDPAASFLLGVNMLNGTIGYEVNTPQGMRLLRDACNKEHPPAVHHLAEMYRNGDPPVDRNDRKFFLLMERAAELGNAESMYALGDLYYKGGSGVEIDYAKAHAFFMEASQHNHAPGAHAVGVMFQHGIGCEKNLNYAMEYYSDAAFMKFPAAMRCIGQMYFSDDSGIRNEKVGRLWLDYADAIEKGEEEEFLQGKEERVAEVRATIK